MTDKMPNRTISSILEKMDSNDIDFRFMALSDLINELQKCSLKADSAAESVLAHKIVKMLFDNNGEVQGLAIKALTPLVKNVGFPAIAEMIEFLVMSLSTIGDAQKESVCGLGLRSVILALEEKGSLSVSDLGIDKAVTSILNIINDHKAESVRLEACEVLSELISVFGSSLVVYHSQLLRTVLMCLFSTRPALRKRAIQACCGLSWSVENQLFSHLCEFLLLKVETCCGIKAVPTPELMTFLESVSSLLAKPMSLSELKTVLQCFCAISKNSARLSLFIPRNTIVCNKVLLETTSLSCFDGEPEDCDLDDIRELALQIFEVVIRGPSRPSFSKLVDNILPSLTRKYTIDFDNEDMDHVSESEESDEDSEQEDDEDYEDDDEDTSWKVRRACLRAIEAAIDSYPQETASFYKLVSPRLLELLASEREESVRMELCNCLSALLKHTRLTSSSSSLTVSQRSGEQSSTITLHNALSFNSLLAPSIQAELDSLLQDANSPNSQLALIMPQLCRLLFLQCAAPGTMLSDGLKRSKSLPKMTPAVRHAGILLVKDLAFAMPGQLKAFLEHVIAIVQSALSDPGFSNTAKIDFVNVLVLLLMTHPSAVLKPHLAKLVEVTAIGLKDPFYRVVLEALDLCQLLARSLKILAGNSFVNSLVKPLLVQVQAQDKDLELREKALSTAAIVVSQVGDLMEALDVKACLDVVKTRLSNETTSLTAVKAIQILASSADSELSNGYCSTFLPPVLEQVSNLLLKSQRNLRLASLHCLHTSWSHKATLLLSTTGDYQNSVQTCITNILHELPQLINDSELLTAHLSIQLTIILLNLADPVHPQLTEKLQHLLSSDDMLCSIEALSLSPLLQGSAQQHAVHQLMFEVGRFVMRTGKPSMETVLGRLFRSTHGTAGLMSKEAPAQTAPVHRDALPNIAASVVEVLASLPDSDVFAAVQHLVDAVKGGRLNCAQQYIDLLIIGGLASRRDLSDRQDLFELMAGLCLAANVPQSAQVDFSGESGSTTGGTISTSSGASLALGKFVLGKPEVFMPTLLARISQVAEASRASGHSNQFYHLLQALRECIISSLLNTQTFEAFTPFVQQTWTLLTANSSRPEEGIRGLVSECIGRLILMNVSSLVDSLQKMLNQTGEEYAKATLIGAVKYLLISPDNNLGFNYFESSKQDWAAQKLLRQESSDGKMCDTNPLATALREVEDLLRSGPLLARTLSYLGDTSIVVRRSALILFNTVAHQKPALLRPLLDQKATNSDLSIGQLLNQETRIRPELIREVEMGPFKQKEDDGLECRKYAFECLATLLETCINKLDLQQFLATMASGLSDQSEIKILCLQILNRMASDHPLEIVAKLSDLAGPIKNILLVRQKDGQIPIDAMEPLKCTITLLIKFSTLQEIKKHPSFQEMFRTMETQEVPNKMYKEFLLAGARSSR